MSENQNPKNEDKKEPKKMPFNDLNNKGIGDPQNKFARSFMIWAFLILGVFCVIIYFQGNPKAEQRVSYSEYRDFLQNDRIANAIIVKTQLNDFEFRGMLKQDFTMMVEGKPREFRNFIVKLGVVDSQSEKEWESKGIKFRYEEGDSLIWSTLITVGSMVLLCILILVFFRRMQNNGPRGIFSFGKARVRLMNENNIKITFDDVAGADEAKYELQEV